MHICSMRRFYTKETHCKSKNSRVLIVKHFGADLFYLSVLVYFLDNHVETWRSDSWYPPQSHDSWYPPQSLNPQHNSRCVYASYLNVCMEIYLKFMSIHIFLCVHVHICTHACTFLYGVATLSRLHQIVGLFCRI